MSVEQRLREVEERVVRLEVKMNVITYLSAISAVGIVTLIVGLILRQI